MKRKNQQYRICNWPEYNAALVRRGSLTFWFDEQVVKSWHPQEKPGRRGRPVTYSDGAIQCMLVLKAVFHLNLRATEGLFQSVVDSLGLGLAVPDYTTVCRRQRWLAVSLPAVPRREPVHVVVDSTGLKVFGEGEWKVRQHGWSKRRTWRKLHLGVNEASREVTAACVTTNDMGDAEVLPDLLGQVEGPIGQVSADGAYDTRAVYDALAARGAQAAIPPRQGAKIWQHGNSHKPPHARDENLRCIRRQGRQRWKEMSLYHRRSLAENAMFRIKTLFGHTLKARKFVSQAVEAFIRCAALNRMTRLGMPKSYAIA